MTGRPLADPSQLRAIGVHRGCMGVHGKPPALGVLPEPPARTGPSCQEAAAVLPEQTADLEAAEQPAPALGVLPEPPAELEAASLTVHPAVSLDARR